MSHSPHYSLIVELFPVWGRDTPYIVTLSRQSMTDGDGWRLVAVAVFGGITGGRFRLVAGLVVRPTHRLRAMDREPPPGLGFWLRWGLGLALLLTFDVTMVIFRCLSARAMRLGFCCWAPWTSLWLRYLGAFPAICFAGRFP